jgi:uncharacterized protein (DUF1330 family)
MAGYLIVTIKSISDLEKVQQYRAKAGPTIAQFGGASMITPRNRHQFVEGGTAVGMVVYRFPTYERALEWYNSPEYQAAAELRHGVSEVQIVIVEGND